MPKVVGTYAHSMTKVEAADASKKAVTKLLAAFEATDTTVTSEVDIHGQNVGFSCKSRGFNISGKITIKDKEVDAVVVLPIIAIAFKKLVKAAMDKHIPKYLEGEHKDG